MSDKDLWGKNLNTDDELTALRLAVKDLAETLAHTNHWLNTRGVCGHRIAEHEKSTRAALTRQKSVIEGCE